MEHPKTGNNFFLHAFARNFVNPKAIIKKKVTINTKVRATHA